MNSLIKKLKFALKKYNMLTDGDTVAVFTSGGKDSLTLLYLLSQIRPHYSAKFNIKSILLDILVEDKPKDCTSIEKLCKKLNVSFYVIRRPLWEIVFNRRKEKNPCSLCSKMRKGILNETALKLSCNKVALGHHFDDAVETLVMNTLYNCKLNCFSPVTYLSNTGLTVIRPLIFCKETQIKNYAKTINLPIILNDCPANNNTSRQKIKNSLNLLEKSLGINLKQNIFKSFLKLSLNGW